jgi:hypothetical protein
MMAVGGLVSPARRLPHLDVEYMMDARERAVPLPQVQVVPDDAARRQVLRQRFSLAPGPEHVEDRVQHLPDVDAPRPTAPVRRTDQRRYQIPLGVREIAVVTQARVLRARPIRVCCGGGEWSGLRLFQEGAEA